MTSLTLFGLYLAPLYAAIAEVESNNGDTSPNVYQIDAHATGRYIEDVNRIMAKRAPLSARSYKIYRHSDVFNRSTAEFMMAVYWSYWGEHYEKKTGLPVSYEVLARIHNGGPLGWKKIATVGYWIKVRAAMAAGGAK